MVDPDQAAPSPFWFLECMVTPMPGFEFFFCKASTVVLRSQIFARTLSEFYSGLSKVGLDSV
jgi:hypothetical protein